MQNRFPLRKRCVWAVFSNIALIVMINDVLCSIRRGYEMANLFQKMDELFFNFRKKAVPEYQGTTKIWVIPTIASFIFGIYAVFHFGLLKGGTSSATDDILGMACAWVFPVWLLNELVLMKRVFILPGIFRKFFYPIFVALLTVVIFWVMLIGFIIAWWIFMFILALYFAFFVLAPALFAASGSSSSRSDTAPPASMPTCSSDSSSEEQYARTATISDGSAWGTKLTEQSSGSWKGDDGNDYTRNWDGSFSKK